MRGHQLKVSLSTCGLKRLALVALVSAIVLLPDCRRGAEREPQPAPRDANILLITLDTTRADHLSCYADQTSSAVVDRRYRGAKTPHLDVLAARGTRFTHAIAQVPLTLPSHASIMTGTYPPVHGLRDMGGFILDKSHPTIASIAQAAGFTTAAFVGSRVLSRHFGLANSFATYDDDMGRQDEEGMLPGIFPERRAAAVTDRALDWLKQNRQARFFLWVHYYDPHAPYDPPQPYKRIYAKDPYSGEIAYTDAEVGRLFDWLDQQGLSERTLVVVIGDHGESLGEHGEMTHGIFLYDSTTHVPFIMAGPEVPAGKVIEDQVRSIDVEPTILEFFHLSPGREAQGVSLWPLVKEGRRVRANYAYLETIYPRTYMRWSELRAMRTDTWKLIVAPRPELYNLEQDPQESANLISRFPADADQLQKKIWEVAGSQGKQEKVISTAMDPATRQELESLGYVSAGKPREIQLGTDAPDPKDRVAILKSMDEYERLMRDKSYPRAAALMEQASRKDPANPLCLIYLATAFERMRNFRRAAEIYQHAVDSNLGTDLIYTRLGKAYLRLHKIEEGVAAMLRANELNPTDLDNLRNLGTAELQLNRVNEAERAFKAITLQNDRYGPAYNGLGLVAIQRGDVETARRNFERAVEAAPDEVEPLLNLGLLYQKTGNRQLALTYYRKFLEKAPRDQYAEQIPLVQEAIQELRGGS